MEHGVENIIEVCTDLLEGFDQVSDAKADGKIDITEWFAITMKGIQVGPKTIKSIPKFVNLDDQKTITIKEAIKAKLAELKADVPEDKWEDIASKILTHVIGIMNVGNDIYKDIKAA